MKHFIDYSWETEIRYVLMRDVAWITIFTLVHFTNMLYLDMELCGDKSDENCESREAFFAILNGRANPFIIAIIYVELFLCGIIIIRECRDFYINKHWYMN